MRPMIDNHKGNHNTIIMSVKLHTKQIFKSIMYLYNVLIQCTCILYNVQCTCTMYLYNALVQCTSTVLNKGMILRYINFIIIFLNIICLSVWKDYFTKFLTYRFNLELFIFGAFRVYLYLNIFVFI